MGTCNGNLPAPHACDKQALASPCTGLGPSHCACALTGCPGYAQPSYLAGLRSRAGGCTMWEPRLQRRDARACTCAEIQPADGQASHKRSDVHDRQVAAARYLDRQAYTALDPPAGGSRSLPRVQRSRHGHGLRQGMPNPARDKIVVVLARSLIRERT